MVFNSESQSSKRIVLPRINLISEGLAPDPAADNVPAKPPRPSTMIPVRVETKQQTPQAEVKHNEEVVDDAFRGDRDVFLNKDLTSGACLGRDRKGAEYSYRIEKFFHDVSSDMFNTPSTEGTQLKKSPSDNDFFSKTTTPDGEETNVICDEEMATQDLMDDVVDCLKEKQGLETSPSNIEEDTTVPDNAEDITLKKGNTADKSSGVADIETENAKEWGDEKGVIVDSEVDKMPENFLTKAMEGNDSKLKRLWRDMLRWKGINERNEDNQEKRKAINFEEFHAVLEFLKY